MTQADAAILEGELLAADAVGDVIEHWGFRKALGRTWTALYLHGEAMPAGEIAERLSMSAGATSMTLTELQRWGVVRRVWKPGERREFFEAETDFWKMISKVVNERERFLAGSVRERLTRADDLMKGAPQSAAVREKRERIGRLLAFSSTAEKVIATFVTSRFADFGPFSNLLELAGNKVRGRAATR